MNDNTAQANLHKHLEFVQLTITRMAANSFVIKGWAVTLVAAIIAFTSNKDGITNGAWLGLVPALMFWGLDGYYLRQERLFRKLYDAVRTTQDPTTYSMDTKPYANQVKSWPRTCVSVTIGCFYLTLTAVVLVSAIAGPHLK